MRRNRQQENLFWASMSNYFVPRNWLPTKQKRRRLVEQQHRPYIGSDLYDACLEMNWGHAEALVREQPLLAQYQEGDNLETPLFVACQNQPPLKLVHALLEAWPQAVSTKSRQGELPLHIAARYQAPAAVLRRLVQDFPDTACRRTRWGATPLVAFWEAQQEGVRHVARSLMDRSSRESSIQDKLTAVPSIVDGYKQQVTDVLLRAVVRHRRMSITTSSINTTDAEDDTAALYCLHAAVSLGSSTGYHRLVLFYAFSEYPQQATMRDQAGRLPLHIAVGPDNSSSPTSQWKFRPQEFWSIKLALHFHPESASLADPNEPAGRHPLHTALTHHHEICHGVQELVEAAPHVLSLRDPVTGLVPFLMASARSPSKVAAAEDECRSLDTTWALLRADPSVLERLRLNMSLKSTPGGEHGETRGNHIPGQCQVGTPFLGLRHEVIPESIPILF